MQRRIRTIRQRFLKAVGVLALFDREHGIGEPADFFAEQRGKSAARLMGVLELKKGPNPVFFKLTGKNAKSSGLGLDLVTLTPTTSKHIPKT